MPLTRSQDSLADQPSPVFSTGTKLSEVEQALLWSLLQEEPQCPSRVLLDKAAQSHLVIAVSLRQVNRWRATWGLNRGKGRPCQSESPRAVAAGAQIVRAIPQMSFVGVHLFAHWLHQRDAFAPVVAQLEQAVATHQQTHPDDDFALLHHRQSTLLHRFEALFYAPLLGIAYLSEFDTREHPLPTLIGGGHCTGQKNNLLKNMV